MATLLDTSLLDETLHALPGWHADAAEIWREVHLDPGTDGELRRRIDEAGASMGHRPRVETVPGGTRFTLSTPEEGGVTELDIVLASHISDEAHRLDPAEPGVHAVRQDEVEIVHTPELAG
jgi:4a-hydroxytetrahydrobiopterin dehydratase